MTMTPSSAFQVRPRPPKRLVPPMTAAAMTFISRSPAPALWLAAAILEAQNRPPMAAKVPEIAKTEIRIRGDVDAGAAGGLDAAAEREDLAAVGVRRSTKSVTTRTTRKITSASGRPWYWLSTYAAAKASTREQRRCAARSRRAAGTGSRRPRGGWLSKKRGEEVGDDRDGGQAVGGGRRPRSSTWSAWPTHAVGVEVDGAVAAEHLEHRSRARPAGRPG